MNVQLGKAEINQLLAILSEKIADTVLPTLLEQVNHQLDGEELLTKKEVCERILKCDVNTADTYFLYAPGFPYVDFGRRGRRYPKKQVEKWIAENTKYNK